MQCGRKFQRDRTSNARWPTDESHDHGPVAWTVQSLTCNAGEGISIVTGLLRRKREGCSMLAIYFFVIPGSQVSPRRTGAG